ncbi:BlaI/MecI/CopY family transcriptional regulator [Acutalibacter sp. 1XD8-36]|uniref:BlaI/MecI/CopY family transcriptional regulator n=1 Tax=Acutalibacter sp. 1XD8-36 TaxID=2320852 RepID=UPI002618D2B2|nr:BlaI/MecI/CopY family transcriptional regulator [Acutalibacter sp. 1XD8-36]
MAFVPLTKTEEKLMLFLWEQDRPLTVSEMLDLLDERAWTKNYTRDIVRSLKKKGAIAMSGLIHSRTNFAQQFLPGMTKAEYYAGLARHNGVSLGELFRAEASAMAEGGMGKELDGLIRELEGAIWECRGEAGRGRA